MKPDAGHLEHVSIVLARVYPELSTPRDLRLERTWRQPEPRRVQPEPAQSPARKSA